MSDPTTDKPATALLVRGGDSGGMEGHSKFGFEALNWTTCAMMNATELERLNVTGECEELMGPPLPMALMTVIQVRSLFF